MLAHFNFSVSTLETATTLISSLPNSLALMILEKSLKASEDSLTREQKDYKPQNEYSKPCYVN